MKFILGKKIKMSQVFDEKGNVIPVTLVEAGPCYVTQIKTKTKDEYGAVQIGFEKIENEKKIKKPMKNKPYRYLRELRIKAAGTIEATEVAKEIKVGDEINTSIFKEGEIINISSISKGKGFAGGVKRWGFEERAKAHGAKDMRKIGSVGGRFPQRVIKGKKMPGRMGNQRVTIKNLEIVKIDPENNLFAIKGAIPGRRGTILEIKGQ